MHGFQGGALGWVSKKEVAEKKGEAIHGPAGRHAERRQSLTAEVLD
jgi:hypothetical protein